MKKITLFLIMLGFFLTASAQYDFAAIVGPTNVAEGTPTTINLNDVANATGVTASSTGSYDSFSVTADWSAGGGNPYSAEADLTITTSAGSITIDPPTTNGNLGDDAVITFVGDFIAVYDPTTDGFLDIVLNQSWAGSDANWSNIIVTLFESPTCVVPTGMVTSNLTTTSVDLTWNAGDSETIWNIEYNSGADFIPGNGEEEGSANVTATPTTSFSGLTESTQYFVYYQADCGGANGTSEWVGPFNFLTAYCESVPTSVDGDGVTEVQLGSEIFTSAGPDVTYEDFTTPTVDLAAAITSNLQITFATGFTYGTNVWIDFNNDLVFDSVTELVYQGESTNVNPTTLDASFTMPDVPLGVYNMRIGTADTGQATPNPCYSGTWGVTMDFTVNITAAPDCIPPSALVATTITEDSTDLTWDGGATGVSWDLEWGPTGFVPGTGTLVPGLTATTYPLTGLMAGTAYDFYVVSNCATGTSTVSGPSTFITATPGETCANAFPMTVEVDCDAATPITFNFANGADLVASGENPSCDGFGNFGYWMSFTAPAIGSVIINFDGAADGIGLEVFDACGGTAISDCENNNLDAGDNSGIIGGLTPGNTYFAVIWRDQQNGTADICIEEGPACPFPINLEAVNITESSADLGWTENGTATSWNIEWGPTGFVPGTGTLVNGVTTNPYNLTGLTQNTEYDFYVQAVCTGGPSDFEGPFTFTTTPQSNFTLDCAVDGPLTQDYCYDNGGANNPLIFTFTSSDGTTPLNLSFNSGFVENGWDELVVLDSDGTPFPGFAAADDNYGNAGNIGGLTFQSTGATISFFINSDGTASCQSSTTGDLPAGINYTVSCATCINPQATYTVIDDCDNGDQFLIDVDITSLGDATSLTISNNNTADTTPVTATGVYQIGPFPFLVDVVVTISNDQDANCVINSQAIQLLACPPDNDNCDGAISAVVNDDSTCDLFTSGTILAATPSGVPNGTCPGDTDDDVWFEFTALNEVQIISLLNITGGIFDLSHGVYEGSCGALTEIYCSGDESSVTPALTVGNTYYIRVFSGGSDAETSTFDLCIRDAPNNIICENAENFCSVGGALTSSNIVGIPSTGPVACLGSIPNPTWNIIQVGESGPIEIQIEQTDDAGGGLDVDFVVWGPFASVENACIDIILEDCPTCPFSNNPDTGFYPFGNIVDCSYSAASVENLSIDNALADEIYILLVTNFNGGPGNITIEQTNAGGTDNGTIEAEISAEITSEEVIIPDDNDPTEIDIVDVCGFDSVTIEANSPFADEYVWFEDGIEMEGEISSTLVVTESNNYQVQAYDDQCGDNALSQIVIVNLYNDAGSVAPQNITVCDGPEADGTETFDLDALSASLGLTDFTVSYYTNTTDANQAMNPVASLYNSTGETLIMRIEDSQAAADGYLGCRQLSQVELVVNANPGLGDPSNLETCSATGFASFDLTSNNAVILNGLNAADYTISYHASMLDAENGDSALTSTYTNTSNPQTIYVRVEDNTTSCSSVTTFDLVISSPLQTATSQNIMACDDNDGAIDDFANFDLAAHTSIVLGAQNPSDYNVTYHQSQADADANTNPLSGSFSSDGETIYVRVEDATLPDCYVTNSFDLVLNLVPQATIDGEFDNTVCPPPSVSTFSIGIVPSNFTEADVSVSWDLDGSPFSGSGITLDNVVVAGDYTATITFNDTGCSNTVTIEVVELESCVFPEGISPGVSPGQNDSFDLRSFDVTELQIFNRNGTLVYSKTDYTNEWVGQTNDGEELPVGTYFYTVIYEGGAKQKSAWVYINR